MSDGCDFVCGATGIIKPVGGPKTKFELSEVKKLYSFTVTSYLPMTQMIFEHILQDDANNNVIITHRVVMQGLTAPFFAFIIGRKIKAGLPEAMSKLINLAMSNK